MRRLVLIPVLLLAAVAFGQELLVNGDFEQDLSVGWTRIDSGTVTHEANRDVGYEPDPDYEAYVYTYDNPGSTILVQTVEVPCALVEFSFRAAFVESAGSSSCWPAACVSVFYYNASDALLGETRYYYSTYANWTESPTLSLYQVTDPAWNQYRLDVQQELATKLTGIDPAQITKIGVALNAYTSGG
jgi:hypothetical protein